MRTFPLSIHVLQRVHKTIKYPSYTIRLLITSTYSALWGTMIVTYIRNVICNVTVLTFPKGYTYRSNVRTYIIYVINIKDPTVGY